MADLDTNKYRILITDDDDDARLVLRLMIERDGYKVYEAKDGQEAITTFEEITPDVVFMDCMMPNVDGFTAVEKIRTFPESKDVPIVMVTALNDDNSIQRAFKAGATDYITKPVQVSVIRHRLNRLIRTKQAENDLRQVIEDQKILHRLDREIGYTLNLDRVLNLAMDTAIRRIAAASCVLGWINPHTRQLERMAGIGGSHLLDEPISALELTSPEQILAPVFTEDKPIHELKQDALYNRLLIPLIVRGKAQGVLALEGVLPEYYDQSTLDFLVHLASRTAEAIEKGRIYKQSQDYNVLMDQLNEINTAISSSLNRQDIIEMSTRGLAVLLGGSSAFFCEYQPRTKQLVVKSRFIIEGLNDAIPNLDDRFAFAKYTELETRFHQGPVQFQPYDKNQDALLREFTESFGLQAGLLLPLMSGDSLAGLLVLGESRYERYFNTDEMAIARSLSIHVAIMLNQAELFTNIKELEQVKSEMIRMASHDLKNPLLQVQGYLDLLLKTLQQNLDAQQQEFANRIKSGTDKMNTLIEDILNLERVESHRTIELQKVDLHHLMQEIVAGLKPQSEIKHQKFVLEMSPTTMLSIGNEIQLKQALTNLVGNAIKYTPENGDVAVRIKAENGEFKFEVQDTGYGIPLDRQSKIFERFYRARTPGTEDIPGTGLGLSLVKSVIERHGGRVWFTSTEGEGSVFGCALPLVK